MPNMCLIALKACSIERMQAQYCKPGSLPMAGEDLYPRGEPTAATKSVELLTVFYILIITHRDSIVLTPSSMKFHFEANRGFHSINNWSKCRE